MKNLLHRSLMSGCISSKDYLTIEALEDGLTASLSTNTCEYRIDDGSWNTLSPNSNTSSINKGQTLSFRGNLTPNSADGTGIGTFTVNKAFNVRGNIMSLLYGNNFEGKLSLVNKNNVFYGLFNNNPIVDASNLILPAIFLSEYCYFDMFRDCTLLTAAPELPATTLANDCYVGMFEGCTSLTTAPELPATTLADHCYEYMFYGCTSLTTAPALPATTLADCCYGGMFFSCTSLTVAPELPATTLADYCYGGMFNGCTSLTTAPELPATTLARNCYQYMFNGCTSLTTAPELPATTLADYCYYYMFNGCTSLTSAPELPATTLADYCYYYMFNGCVSLIFAPMVLRSYTLSNSCYSGMFQGCTSLRSIGPIYFSEIGEYTDAFYGMLNNCEHLEQIILLTDDEDFSNSGYGYVLYMNDIISNVKSLYGKIMTNININHIDFGQIDENVNGGWENICYSQNASTLYINRNNCMTIKVWENNFKIDYDFDDDVHYSYSINGFNLNDEGDEINQYYFKKGDTISFFDTNIYNFSLEQKCELIGDCMSLNQSFTRTFEGLFANCTGITKVSKDFLPATTLVDSCYVGMFEGCTSLTTAPALPATTLANDCYSYMFYGCTSLTTAPALPATTLADYCYCDMFSGCTSLTTAPALPATTLADYCYSGMFCDCINLNYIKMLATDISATDCLDNWVNGVATEGIFVKNTNMTSLPTGASGIPSGWVVQDL